MFEYWLSLWNDSELPGVEQFRKHDILHLAANVLIFEVAPDTSISVRFAGANFAQRDGLIASDWLSNAPAKSSADRLRRFDASARGAIVRGMPEAILRSEPTYFYEAIHFPFRPAEAGSTPILVYVDWDPSSTEDMDLPPSAAANLPIITEIFPLARDQTPPPTGPLSAQPVESEHAKIVSRAAMRFLLSIAGDIMLASLSSGLGPFDYYLAVAVGSANVSHLDSDPTLSRQYAGLIEPDYMRRGISRAAISRSTGLPQETVRRRINKMIALELLLERKDGVILSANNRLRIGTHLDQIHGHAQQVERLFRDLQARGVRFDQ